MMRLNWDCINFFTEEIQWEKKFIKEFDEEYLSEDTLKDYHILHTYLGKYEKDVYFGDIEIDWEKIDNRNIRILPLDQELISTQENKKWEFIIKTIAEYIEWKTLEYYRDKIWKDVINQISDSITRRISQLTWIEFTDMYWVKPINIKINIKDWTAYLIVTDISCNIKNLFYTWKNILKIKELAKKEICKTLNS